MSLKEKTMEDADLTMTILLEEPREEQEVS
jgi:hypothetical protein